MKLFKTILSALIFFLMLFGIKFSFIPVGLSKGLLVFLLGYYLIDIYIRRRVVRLPKRIIYALAILFILFFYAGFITVLNGINDFQYGSKLIFLIYEPILGGFLSAYFVINYLRFDLDEVLKAFSNAIFLQAILTVCAYLIPSINDAFNALLPNFGNIGSDQDTRVRGFTNLGGAWLSVILAMGVILNLYFFGLGTTAWKRLGVLFKVLLCMGGTFVTGRTGLLLSLLSVIVFCFYWIFILRKPKAVLNFFSPIVLFVLLVYFFLPSADLLISQNTINWALEIFLNSDSMSTASGNDLMSMLYLPSDVYHLIFGVGFYETGIMFYPRSDSGYVKTILSVGILGAVLFYSIFIYYFGIILKYLYRFYGKREISLFCYLFTIFLLIELKEPYLQALGVTNFVFFLFFYLENKANHYEQN